MNKMDSHKLYGLSIDSGELLVDENPKVWNTNVNPNNSNVNWNNNPDNDNPLVPLSQPFIDITKEQVFEGYLYCRKHKRWKNSAVKFEINLERNIIQLYNDLRNGTYNISKALCFIISDPKFREIFASDFRDRIVHHIIINVLEQEFENYYDDASFNCRKDRGTLKAALKLQEYIREYPDYYILGLDIKSFFPSIPKKQLLYDLLRFVDISSIQQKSLVKYLIIILLSNNITENCRIIKYNRDKIPKDKTLLGRTSGIPIGDLTSLFFANFLLTRIDLFISNKNYKHIRYVDDFRIILPRNELNKIKLELFEFIQDLGLYFNPDKVYILPCIKGCPFIGYFVTINYILPGNRLKYKIHKLLYNKKFKKESIVSYIGFLSHCRAYKMLNLIRTTLLLMIYDIDSGNSNISEKEQNEILQLILKVSMKQLSKIESANYIGVSRATFDNYIRNGWIPKGTKRQGFKELSWNKSDLDKFVKINNEKLFK